MMRKILTVALLATTIGWSVPALAQSGVEGRVDRLEREMRAVQRKVFPGGAGGTVDPDITPVQAPTDLPGTPAGSAVADLTARVSALEASVRSVTGQAEQNGYRLRQLEDAFNAYKRTTDARLKALEDGATATGVGAVGDTSPAPAPVPSSSTPRPTTPRPAVPTPKPASSTLAADPVRAASVKGVEKPSTGDEGEDLYTYGYRLWEAKLYPEAQAALKQVPEKFPRHRRASFAQNLLGRAYLDEGKPSLASLAFYDSYKKFPDGARAPDSLFYLAQALVKLKKPAADVCKVYTELTEVYGDKLSASMKADVEKGRVAQKCK